MELSQTNRAKPDELDCVRSIGFGSRTQIRLNKDYLMWSRKYKKKNAFHTETRAKKNLLLILSTSFTKNQEFRNQKFDLVRLPNNLREFDLVRLPSSFELSLGIKFDLGMGRT